MDDGNPYDAPGAPDASDNGRGVGHVFWPNSPGRCFLLAVLVFPLIALFAALAGVFRDSGVDPEATTHGTPALALVAAWIAGVTYWIRGFRLWSRTRTMLSPTLYAILTLPVWFIASAVLSLPIIVLR